MKKSIWALLITGLVCGQAVHCEKLLDYTTGKPVRYAGKFSASPVWLHRYYPKVREFRGVWVATVENLDFPTHRDAATFRRDYIRLVNNIARANFNAVIFQVRPCNDAFYPSKLNPWSQFLTGTEGTGIRNFDPLKFMVDEAHRRGLEFHAWFNPYRVVGNTPLGKAAYLKRLSPGNFARRNPGLVMCIPQGGKRNQLILNPGEPAVMRHIIETVREVVGKYRIDAVHFDDYFYPYEGLSNQDWNTYRRYSKGMKLDDWRRQNVTTVIRAVRGMLNERAKVTGRRIRFGISPFGIWANRSAMPEGSLTGGLQSYFRQYADTRGWVKRGYIDYIVPQLYWEFSHETAAYAALSDWWSNTVRGTRTKLFIGHAASRLGSSRKWSAQELPNQLRYNCGRPEISGSVLFSYRHVFCPANRAQKLGVGYVLKRFWNAPAALPW